MSVYVQWCNQNKGTFFKTPLLTSFNFISKSLFPKFHLPRCTRGAAYIVSASELIHQFLRCCNLCCIHFKYQNMGKMKRLSYINTVYLTGLVTFNNQENLGIHSISNVLVHVHVHERLSWCKFYLTVQFCYGLLSGVFHSSWWPNSGGNQSTPRRAWNGCW